MSNIILTKISGEIPVVQEFPGAYTALFNHLAKQYFTQILKEMVEFKGTLKNNTVFGNLMNDSTTILQNGKFMILFELETETDLLALCDKGKFWIDLVPEKFSGVLKMILLYDLGKDAKDEILENRTSFELPFASKSELLRFLAFLESKGFTQHFETEIENQLACILAQDGSLEELTGVCHIAKYVNVFMEYNYEWFRIVWPEEKSPVLRYFAEHPDVRAKLCYETAEKFRELYKICWDSPTGEDIQNYRKLKRMIFDLERCFICGKLPYSTPIFHKPLNHDKDHFVMSTLDSQGKIIVPGEPLFRYTWFGTLGQRDDPFP
jgi:hypothetical protein